MTLVSSLNIARQALSVTQAAITVVSNNISNVSTEGYSKLTAELSDVVSYSTNTNVIGQANSLSGVQLSQIKRSSDAYLQSYYWNENADYTYYKEAASVASNVESIVNELNDSGLSTALSNFYTAVTQLSSDPTDSSARANFVSTAENVCSVFNSYSDSLTKVVTSLVGDPTAAGSVDSSEISSETTTINSLLTQIADVNKSLNETASSGLSSSSLLDERDSLITKLSGYMNAEVNITSTGLANISIGGHSLINGSTVVGTLGVQTGTASEPAQVNILDSSGTVTQSNINSSITSGSMGAILDVCGTSSSGFTISSVMSDLDTLASSFANIMNTIQTGDPNGDNSVALCIDKTTGQLTKANNVLFVNGISATNTTGITAANISVSTAIQSDNDLVAAARVSNAVYTAVPSTYPNDTGNNSNATLITKTKTNKYSSASAPLNNQTITGYLDTAVAKVGYSSSDLTSSLSTQTTVLSEIKSQLSSETGVNLDEELSDLIKYQRAYESSARVFSTVNDLLGELIQIGK